MDKRRVLALTAAAVLVFGGCSPAASSSPASQTPASAPPSTAASGESQAPASPAAAAATAPALEPLTDERMSYGFSTCPCSAP